MKNSKAFIWIVVVATIVLAFSALSYAGEATSPGASFTLPNGTQVPLDGLSEYERGELVKNLSKVAEAQVKKSEIAEESVKVMADVISDPNKLEAWRKMLTGTIRDICDDLNVSVNEFVKTPVGAGVAALIIYKVAGKEILSEVVDVILIIPFWFIMMGTLFYLQRRYLGTSLVYERVWTPSEGKAKEIKEDPKRIINYPWASKDARVTFACVLYGTMLVITLITLLIVF